MAGVKIEYNDTDARRKTQGLISYLKNPAPLFAVINEYLLQIHRQRFKQQVSPDGTPWAALSPRYQKRKHRNKNKILTLRGHLQGTLRGQYDDEGLEFGTDRIYGARQHFGDKALAAFQPKTKTSSSKGIPARPWLGTSDQNDNAILDKTIKFLQRAVRA